MVTRLLFDDERQPPEQPGAHPSFVCRLCGRGLSDPVSIKRGLGSVCARKAGGAGGVLGAAAEDDPRTKATLPFDPATGDVTCTRTPGDRMAPGTVEAFNINQSVVHHSPTGFEWGYGGSGPADFALNVLQLYVPRDGEPLTKCYDGFCSQTAWLLHQDFKGEFISRLPDAGGTIKGSTIREWLLAHEVPADLIKLPAA